MDWKEFFKPTEEKIKFTVLTLLSTIVFFIVSFVICLDNFSISCELFFIPIISFLTLPFVISQKLFHFFGGVVYHVTDHILLETLFTIIWIYFLVCIGFFPYNNSKRKDEFKKWAKTIAIIIGILLLLPTIIVIIMILTAL